jgi:deoxyribodipyrimidine photo-lyase
MNLTYASILEQVKAYQPGKYPTTRNYTNGAVTNWSPYISRGLLSPVLVMEQLKSKYNKQEWIGFMQQMAWREYFQRVWQHKGDLILQDLKSTQSKIVLASLPKPINAGKTGIQALDNAIHHLYKDGMMHNHVRMYISMLHSNIFKAAWLPGAKWMYANLLDHDPAANFLSWQWVAGTFSSKQYIANQENINKYTNSKQLGTFLDTEYEHLQTSIFDDSGTIQTNHAVNWSNPLDEEFEIDTITILKKIENTNQSNIFNINQVVPNKSFCIYNSFNLDPLWHADEDVHRILILEPNHFEKFPVTEKVVQFVIDLATNNIPGLQIFIGNFEDLFQHIETFINNDKNIDSEKSNASIYFKEHPTTQHYKGIEEARDWLFPEVNGYFPSFFGYWKKCERYI